MSEQQQFYRVMVVMKDRTVWPGSYNLPALLDFLLCWEEQPETYNPNIEQIIIEKEPEREPQP